MPPVNSSKQSVAMNLRLRRSSIMYLYKATLSYNYSLAFTIFLKAALLKWVLSTIATSLKLYFIDVREVS